MTAIGDERGRGRLPACRAARPDPITAVGDGDDGNGAIFAAPTRDSRRAS